MTDILRLFFILLLCSFITGVSSDSLLADTDEDLTAQLKGWDIRVSPASFRYDDEITVTISGLPRNFPFDRNSVTLGGAKLHVPNDGSGPRGLIFSDDVGILQFKTSIPDGLSSGLHYLRVDIRGNFVARTSVELQPIKLRVSSSVIVPYKEVWVVGMGFTEATGTGGNSSKTIKETNLTFGSPAGVTIGGESVHGPHIEYPVRLGRNGSVFFRIIVPELESTMTPGQVELRVRDSEGREGVVALTVPIPELQLESYVSYPGEDVLFSVTGLPVSRENINDYVEVVYGYAIDKSGTKYAPRHLGLFRPDNTGRISGKFSIPAEALLSSSNKVWVRSSNGRRWNFNHYLAGRSISVEPTSGLQGDQVQITIKGMPNNYPLTVGSVTLGSYRVSVPGHLGLSGPRPISNDVGFLTFISVVPSDVLPGDHDLSWIPPGGGKITTAFRVMESKLHFDPPWVTPGQTVTVTSESHSEKMEGVKISGNGVSYVFIDNQKKFHDVIDYPIELSPDGYFETSFKVPISREIAAKHSVEVTTYDTSGRTARGILNFNRRSATVTPLESIIGSNILIEGTGFFANPEKTNSPHRVIISYGGLQIGSEILDDVGSFKKTLSVPASAVVGSENQVTVALEGWPLLKTYSSHRVPNSAANVAPDIAFPGEIIAVTGTGFTPFRQVTIGIGHLWTANAGPAVHTDRFGEFEVLVEVPLGLSKGLVDLKVYAHYPVEVASIPFNIR